MNYFEDTWHVIDTYFKNNPYFLTKHHLESWNDFVSNRITSTIKVLNPYVILKNQENGRIEHEINIFVGGLEGTDIFLTKPTIYEDGEQRIMYPNEARIRDLTYQTEMYANIVVRYITKEVLEGGEENTKIEEKLFSNVKIGAFPIMLHSKLCCLYDQPFDVLREMGECPYDQGGYFIVDGKEKVIVAQERIALNKLFINKSKDDSFSYQAMVRCISEDNPLFPKTIYLYVTKDSSKYDYKKIVKKNKGRIPNSISITCPNVQKELPIFIVFRALGIESDREILEYILYDIDDPKNESLIEFLRYSILDSNKVITQQDALEYIKQYVEYNSVEKVRHVLINDLFPNVGHEFRNKALFLGHLMNKLVKTVLGIISESDRDNYVYKRVDISGFLVGNLFRDYYNQFRNTVRSLIDKQYLFGPWKTTKDITNLLNKMNIASIFQSSIIEDGFRKSLKGSWGKSMIEEVQDAESIKQGIVQDLSRISYLGFMSHLRRVNTPMDPTSKIVAPHRLHPSQWGIMCPIESPDGASIGLLKHFAVFCHVTFESGVKPIMECLRNIDMITFMEEVTLDATSIATKVSINSNWIGITFDAPKVFRLLKLLKRNGFIDKFVAISWDIIGMEINISTEAGRCVRPVYVVEDGKLLVADFLTAISNGEKTWTDLIEGTLKSDTKNPWDLVGGSSSEKYEELIEKLTACQSVIEYIDVEEANCSLVAIDGLAVIKDMKSKSYTHCEIHPSVMLGTVSQNIPLCNHNQAPRNIFFGAQGKQAVGMPVTSFNNRIDTMLYVLHYPQKQLVTTRYKEYMYNNVLTGGENLIVAISPLGGDNQEDSIIVNKASIQRGMFNMTYFKNMIHKEEENKNDNERIIFKNPVKAIDDGLEVNNVKFAKYRKTLDDNGYPKVNVYVSESDAIIGKTLVKTVVTEDSLDNLFGAKVKKEVYYDKSVIADKNISGIIDKVYVYNDTENNKTCKLRFRKVKQPELGDKMACYSDDTEVLTSQGWIYFKDLTLNHLVATLVGKKLVYQRPIDLQTYEHNGKMYQVETEHVNLLVTGNHRMYVREKASDYSMVFAEAIINDKIYKKNNDNTSDNTSDKFKEIVETMCRDHGKFCDNDSNIIGYIETTSSFLADDFQINCFNAGWSANKVTIKGCDGSIKYSLTVNKDYNEPLVNSENVSWVDYKGTVYCCTVHEGSGILYVRRNGIPVWCGNSTHGQKGVAGMILPPENMPFNKDGIVPDIIINPHAIPSRMTIGHLLECVLAKTCVNEGMMVDATPFNNNEFTSICDELENKFGLEKYGNELLYNGRTGEQIHTEIFFGPTYYQRLKHMVSDKINYRTTGAMTATTRQPTQGRGNNGGLRIGEMERDTLLSQGIMGFLKESLMERSDKYSFDVETSTGDIAITTINQKKHKQFKPVKDDNTFYSTVQTPYAFKLLLQEIKAMGVKPILSMENIEDDEIFDDYEAYDVNNESDEESELSK